MISESVLAAMYQAGGLRIKTFDKQGNLHLTVNYKIIRESFPAYFQEILKETINEVDYEFYSAGLIAFKITPTGDLFWQPTSKYHKLGNDIMETWKIT